MTSKARTPPRSAGGRVACDGAEEERAGLLPYFVTPMAPLLLLSTIISALDAGVRRKKRGHRVRTQPSGWWAFTLPVPPPPPAKLEMCADCGATQTPQWRAGPEGLGSLCNTCGVGRRADGERWGVPRRRRLPAARTVPDHPSPQEGLPQPDLQSPPSIRICEQPSPAQILASESSPPETAPRKPAKRKSPSPMASATPSTTSEKPAPSNKKNHPAEKQYKHCGSSETPQWREGPKGPRTLCNACGVRHRQGRLLPEYRPKASPTFDKEKHASLHIGVLKLRRQRMNKQPQPVDDNSQDVDLMMSCAATLRHPVPRPVDSELRVGGVDDDSASNAVPPGMDDKPSWEFLIGGPAAPMFIEQEEPCPCVIFID